MANSQKILSLYEPDVRVIVRGKADAEVEFGNTVLVAANAQGIIPDYRVWREPAPADVNLLVESLERVPAGEATRRPWSARENQSGLLLQFGNVRKVFGPRIGLPDARRRFRKISSARTTSNRRRTKGWDSRGASRPKYPRCPRRHRPPGCDWPGSSGIEWVRRLTPRHAGFRSFAWGKNYSETIRAP